MSAVAEIEAAIAKLTKVKLAPMFMPDKYECTDDEFSAACDRIATLNRTIDAQLAILRIGLNAYTEYISDIRRALDHDRAALALARAINNTA